MKKFIYHWHRKLSIIIAFPVLLWAVSGFMHPLMTNIKPAITTQVIVPIPIDSHRILVPLQFALRQNHLNRIANFRLVHIDTNWFYQVFPVGSAGVTGPAGPTASDGQSAAGNGLMGTEEPIPVYLSCKNGKVLAAGDWLYAQYLARQFLEGPGSAGRSVGTESTRRPGGTGAAANKTEPDCCGAATNCVLNPAKGAKVANVSLLRQYDKEYKSINRLLPVYRVDFVRADGIRVYVETAHDRFGFAMDNRRAIFDEIFRLFHTWGWLDGLGRGRLAVEAVLAALAFITSLMGIYIFFVTKTRNGHGDNSRRNHRYVSIAACLFTLLWTFSGCYHALSKFSEDVRDRYSVKPVFAADSLGLDIGTILRSVGSPVSNVSLVRMNGQDYWQVYIAGTKGKSSINYISLASPGSLKDGDKTYAIWLASQFSKRPTSRILAVSPVNTFGDEYNFADKRLPVWRIAYGSESNGSAIAERYFVETTTGRLAKRSNAADMAEGMSFALFHKHHFMDWGGKTTRDISTMFWAFMQVVMVAVGLILYFKWRRRRK